jgi:tetratricopeptide (TPR) repeat protein
MVNSVKDSKSTVCTNCGKAITSLSKNTIPITATREEEYQKQIESGFGMYCPNCDHFLCLTCLPTIGAKSRKKLFSGLFSRTKPGNEMSLEDLPIDNAMRNKLEEKLRVKGTRIVVLRCVACGAYFGEFPEDKKRFVEDFAKKIIEDYDDITISETATFINDLQVFISRLEKYNLINKRAEQLEVVLELAIKEAGLPKLKQLITQHIENKEYDEARELCDKGTQWNGYLKEKGSWENDLQRIETLIKVSKLNSGQKKIIEGGPPRIITIKAQKYGAAHEELGKKRSQALADDEAKAFLAKAFEEISDNAPNSRRIWQKISDQKIPELTNIIVLMYLAKATSLRENGSFQAAVDYYDKAVNIGQKLDDSDQTAEFADNIFKAYMDKGLTLRNLGDNKTAVESYEKAIETLEKLVNLKGNAGLQGKVAEGYFNKGSALHGLGDYRAAFELYDSAIAIWERLVEAEGQTELQDNLSNCYKNKANLSVVLDEYKTAIETCQKGIAVYEELINSEGRTELKGDLALVKITKAIAQALMLQISEARNTAREALPVLRAEAKKTSRADLKSILNMFETNFGKLLE